MVNSEAFKTIMDSFHSMKNHLQNIEKDYSNFLEKSETLYPTEEDVKSVN